MEERRHSTLTQKGESTINFFENLLFLYFIITREAHCEIKISLRQAFLTFPLHHKWN